MDFRRNSMMFITRQAAMNEPMLTVEDERAALVAWQQKGDKPALELLVRSHARQVYAQAARWTDNPTHHDDLVAEGILGLMRAADNFDLGQDVRFSTYASWWILNRIAAALVRTRTVIDLPVRTFFDASSGRLSDEARETAQMAVYGTVELGDGGEFDNALSASVPTPEEAITLRSDEEERQRVLHCAMSRLDGRDSEIVRRLNLDDPPVSVEVLAQEYGLSRDRVRQLEKRALLRLRQHLIQAGFHLEALH